MKLRKRITAVGALAVGTAVALTGCAGGGTGTDGGSGGGNAGGKVVITGAFTGDQQTAFQKDLATWAEAEGIDVEYTGNNSFQTAIITQVRGGQAPNIAIFPQPGVLKSLIGDGMVALEDMIDVPATIADEAAGLPDIAKVNGKTYGLPYSINVKSLVWYNPAAFEKAGLEVPTTDAELVALQEQIISEDLGYPWCLGIASSGSNGWPMTDWFEEYVLRYGGLDQYNKWITHEVLWDSEVVRQAAGKIEDTLFAEGAVNGGGKAAAATDFGVAGNDLFVEGKGEGQCFMMRQGTFITDFFPDDIKAQIADGDTTNINAFVLPTPEGATNGVLGGGDLVAAFKNDDNTKKVLAYITGKEFGTNGYAAGFGSFLSPHNEFDQEQYITPFQPIAAEAVANAEAFGFDASDQMPGAVGAGTAWTNLTQWTSGAQNLDETLKAIDASWPTS